METKGPRFGDTFCLTLVTNDPVLAEKADLAGIDRIGIDLEQVGKHQRQAGMGTRLSEHQLADLSLIAPKIRRAQLFARLNPIHAETDFEIETALDLGARVLMLPNFRTADEVATFSRSIHGRAVVAILVETAPAMTRIREILAVRGVDEVMVGLNDLRLQLGVSNHFELLASPVLEMVAAEVKRSGLPFRVGALGRSRDAGLPVPPDLIYAQYPRLGATGAWSARVFRPDALDQEQLQTEIHLLRQRMSEWSDSTTADLENTRDQLTACAAKWHLMASGHTA